MDKQDANALKDPWRDPWPDWNHAKAGKNKINRHIQFIRATDQIVDTGYVHEVVGEDSWGQRLGMKGVQLSSVCLPHGSGATVSGSKAWFPRRQEAQGESTSSPGERQARPVPQLGLSPFLIYKRASERGDNDFSPRTVFVCFF